MPALGASGRRVAIIAGVRTPFARAGTVLKDITAIELGKRCVAELIQRTNLDGELVEAIVYGTVVPSVIAPNIAREVSLLPMLPRGCEAYTVSRACASANQAITDAADQIAARPSRRRHRRRRGVALQRADPAFARRCRRSSWRSRARRAPAQQLRIVGSIRPRDLVPITPAIAEPSTGETMGQSAEKMAKINHIPREEQDQFALRSHRLAAVGTEDGRLTAEIVPVYVPPRYETALDERQRHSHRYVDRAAARAQAGVRSSDTER